MKSFFAGVGLCAAALLFLPWSSVDASPGGVAPVGPNHSYQQMGGPSFLKVHNPSGEEKLIQVKHNSFNGPVGSIRLGGRRTIYLPIDGSYSFIMQRGLTESLMQGKPNEWKPDVHYLQLKNEEAESRAIKSYAWPLGRESSHPLELKVGEKITLPLTGEFAYDVSSDLKKFSSSNLRLIIQAEAVQ
ncbi:MAG: hypothetical protein GY747_12060 [Planctomycetes bacterium]|nr:hypothetical protein [Planctomycetota bacterium]MCP4771728.1 hypothetical protein [Planctomycetota bacterium]MCP4859972.1 hypothetical protein [Planctomycetota bacterium]